MPERASLAHALTAALTAVVTVTAAGCGGDDRGRPQRSDVRAESVDYCALERRFELLPIADWEPNGASRSARCHSDLDSSVAARRAMVSDEPVIDTPLTCSFYFNYDTANSPTPEDGEEKAERCAESLGAGVFVQTIPPIGAAMPGEDISAPRCGEVESAFHLSGSNVAMCYGRDTGRLGWGGAVELSFPQHIVDASAWDGVAFWVRKGSATPEPSVLFTVSDQNTWDIPETGQTAPCTAVETAPDSQKCDAFGVSVTLREEWTFVPVYFEAMRQKGFGAPSRSLTLDASTIRRIQVLFSAGDWDYWLDDVAFFRAPAKEAR